MKQRHRRAATRGGAFAAILFGCGGCGPGVGEETAAESASKGPDEPDATFGGSTTEHGDVLITGTGACDLADLGCFGEFPCTNVWIGDGDDCPYLPEGGGLRVFGEPTCMLEAWRDSVVVSFHVNDCAAGGTGLYDLVTVLGDGTAMLWRTRVIDRTYGQSVHDPQRRLVVRDADFFENCLQTEDLAVVRDCLFKWFEPDQCLADACCPVANNSDLPPC